MSEKVTIKQASEELGISPQGVRVQMQRGILPIGTVAKSVKGDRLVYYIYRAKLDEFLGKGTKSNDEERVCP